MFKLTEKAAKRWDMLVIAYTVACLSYQVLYLIAPAKAFLNLSGLSFLSSGLAVLGALFLVVDLFVRQTLFKTRYAVILVAILATLVISSLVNIRMGIVNNAKVIIWQAVQLLLMYSTYKRVTFAQSRALLQGLHTTFSVAFVPTVLVSLYQFLTQKGYLLIVNHAGATQRQGFSEGRLFGLFTSVHFAGVLLSVMIVGALCLAIKTRRVWLRVLYVLEALLFFIYIILSGTRTMFIVLALVGFSACFLLAKDRLHKICKNFLKYAAVVGMSLAVAVCVIGSIQVLDIQLKKIPPYIHSMIGSNQGDSSSMNGPNAQPDEPNDSDSDESINMDRTDVQEDISNNRFTIWNDYLMVTTADVKTVLFGISPGEYMNIIREKYPDIYIVTYIRDNYPVMYEENLIYDIHNGYLTVFVMSGLLGTVVFGAFLVMMGVRVVRRVFSKKPLSTGLVALITIMVIMLVSAFFDSDVFFRCNSSSMLFWVLLGFTVKMMDEEPQETLSE